MRSNKFINHKRKCNKNKNNGRSLNYFFPLEAKSKLPMNYMDLMFQIKKQTKNPHDFKHCRRVVFLFWYIYSLITL